MLGVGTIQPPRGAEFVLCDTPRKIEWLFRQLDREQKYSWDVETTHPTAKGAEGDDVQQTDLTEKVSGISFCWSKSIAAYLPLFANKEGDIRLFRREAFDEVVRSLAREMTRMKRRGTWNGVFDRTWMWWTFGIWVDPCDFDGMLAHHLLDENRAESNHGLKPCASTYVDPMAEQYARQMELALDQCDPKLRRYSTVPLNVIYKYGCADSYYTFCLEPIFRQRMQEEQLDWVFENVTMPLQHTVAEMQVTGLPVAEDRVARVDAELDGELTELNQKIWTAVGHQFDVASAEQLSRALFETLNLRTRGERGKSGFFSTSKDVLADLEDEHPVIKMVQRHRRVSKLLGTYVRGLNQLLIGGRYYQDYRIHGTVTGRLSERLIVLLPRGEKGGDAIKGLFRAPPGWSFLFRDLSQIELRIAAHVSQDPIMLNGYRNGGPNFDLHVATAVRMFNLQIPDGEDVVSFVKEHFKAYRSISKNLNFGSLYGAEAKRLMNLINADFPEMHCTIEKAKEFLRQYFETMAGLRAAIDKAHADISKYGFVVNIFGRRRRIGDAMLEKPADRSNERPFGGPLRRCFGRESPSLSYDLDVDFREYPEMRTDFLQARILNKMANDARYVQDRPERLACCRCVKVVPCSLEKERWQRQSKVEEAHRQAFNFIIQSSAVDYTNLALGRICRRIHEMGFQSRPVLQIHDAVGFLVPDAEMETMMAMTKHEMEHAFELSVPITSDMTVVRSWGDENVKVPKKCGRCGTPVTKQIHGVVPIGQSSRFRDISTTCSSCGWGWRHDAVFETDLKEAA